MKVQGPLLSTALHNAVSFMVGYGGVVRFRSDPCPVFSEGQIRAKYNFHYSSHLWRRLSEVERAAWTELGRKTLSRSRAGRSRPLTGHALFVKINCARAAAWLELVRLPPEPVRFGPSPVGSLCMTNHGVGIELNLSLAKSPGEGVLILVLGAPPCSARRSRADRYTILGLLPAPVRGFSTITNLYVSKYGQPPPGSRIFIRTRQFINGWEDEPKETNALVPSEPETQG